MVVAFAECCAFCALVSVFMLNVIPLSVIMLNVVCFGVMLHVILLDVTFLKVMLSRDYAECRSATHCYAECCISSAMF